MTPESGRNRLADKNGGFVVHLYGDRSFENSDFSCRNRTVVDTTSHSGPRLLSIRFIRSGIAADRSVSAVQGVRFYCSWWRFGR